jgi:hypothetical protein
VVAIFLNAVSKHRCPFSFNFIWETKQNHEQGGRVSRHTVMIKEPVGSWQSSGLPPCTFSLKRLKTSQKSELTVMLGGTNSWWTLPFMWKKRNKTMSLLFVELWTGHGFLLLVTVASSTAMNVVVLFLDHNHKCNFCHVLTCYR